MARNYVRRFSGRADYYSKHRPGYPRGILRILEREVGFTPNSVVADIGSGTGLLARVFLKNGNQVYGVEPGDEMRAYAERELSGLDSFVSVKGTAERTTLKKGSVDLIAVGQALHWFDPPRAAREFSKISKPGGGLCVAYNSRIDDGFGRGYEAVIRSNRRSCAVVPKVGPEHTSRYFKDGGFSCFTLPNEQSLDLGGLMGRILSASYMPAPDESEDYARLRSDVKDLFERYSTGGRVKLRYRTELYVGRVA